MEYLSLRMGERSELQDLLGASCAVLIHEAAAEPF